MDRIKELDSVTAVDNSIYKVPKGTRGVVVHEYVKNYAFEVEFFVNDTSVVKCVTANQIKTMKKYYRKDDTIKGFGVNDEAPSRDWALVGSLSDVVKLAFDAYQNIGRVETHLNVESGRYKFKLTTNERKLLKRIRKLLNRERVLKEYVREINVS